MTTELEKGTVIHLLDNFRATWDGQMNWVLEEYEDVYGRGKDRNKVTRQDWQFKGYYGTVPQLVHGLLARHLIPSEFKGEEIELEEAVSKIKEMSSELRGVLNEWN